MCSVEYTPDMGTVPDTFELTVQAVIDAEVTSYEFSFIFPLPLLGNDMTCK